MMKGKLLIAALSLFLVASCAESNKAPVNKPITPTEQPTDGGWPQISIGPGVFS
ncbi:hypothetical protein WJW27_005945 [Escherichia coli]|nr:hypothetical protein [Escherichia coli]